MNTATKAALLSGLVFPGSGHWLLKQYRRAIGIIAIALLALGIIVTDALQKATLIANKIASGEIPLDATAITEQVDATLHSAGSTAANIATWLLLACWIFGIVDAYRLGKQKDRQA